MIKRRSFIGWGIISLILTRIFRRQSSILAQDNSPEEFYEVGTIGQLKAEGFLLNEDLDIGAVLVKETADKSLIAIDPTCTHAGCLVEWEEGENSFICPCHNSKFQEDGTLIEGLAVSDLVKYQVKVENNLVLVGMSE